MVIIQTSIMMIKLIQTIKPTILDDAWWSISCLVEFEPPKLWHDSWTHSAMIQFVNDTSSLVWLLNQSINWASESIVIFYLASIGCLVTFTPHAHSSIATVSRSVWSQCITVSGTIMLWFQSIHDHNCMTTSCTSQQTKNEVNNASGFD